MRVLRALHETKVATNNELLRELTSRIRAEVKSLVPIKIFYSDYSRHIKIDLEEPNSQGGTKSIYQVVLDTGHGIASVPENVRVRVMSFKGAPKTRFEDKVLSFSRDKISDETLKIVKSLSKLADEYVQSFLVSYDAQIEKYRLPDLEGPDYLVVLASKWRSKFIDALENQDKLSRESEESLIPDSTVQSVFDRMSKVNDAFVYENMDTFFERRINHKLLKGAVSNFLHRTR